MMAKLKAEQLEIGKGWQAFGERLGWQMLGWTDGHHASFFVEGGDTVRITARMRSDIERTWRDQSNVEPIRRGTDG